MVSMGENMRLPKQEIRAEYKEVARKIREDFSKGDIERDSGLTRPENVEWEDDISYGEHGKWNLLDVYYPKGTSGILPTIVSIHGGAWVYGTKEVYQYYGCSLAQHGFTVVNFNYRLAPENPFPAALEDINQLFTWIAAHGKEHHIDAENLFAVGDSAGAQFCAQYAAMLANPEYAAKYDFKMPDIELRAVALNCGCYDMEKRFNGKDRDKALAYFCAEPEAFLPYIDTMSYLNEKFPPAFVMTAQHDFLKDDAKPMAEALKRFGVETEYHLYGDKEHKEIAHVFHCNMKLPEAGKCNDDECAFFRKHIK